MQCTIQLIGKHLILIRQYNKMRAREGFDWFIPSSLHSSLDSIYLLKEVILCPFALHCVHELYAVKPTQTTKVKELYHNYLFVNQDCLSIAGDISKEMKLRTNTHIGMEIGVRAWGLV